MQQNIHQDFPLSQISPSLFLSNIYGISRVLGEKNITFKIIFSASDIPAFDV